MTGGREPVRYGQAAIFSTSADIDVAGSNLRAGRYALWMIPGPETWTVIFSTHQPVFHLLRPEPVDEVLRVRTRSRSGDHVESLAFYFPMVDAATPPAMIRNRHTGDKKTT